jgi:hypothetical protein
VVTRPASMHCGISCVHEGGGTSVTNQRCLLRMANEPVSVESRKKADMPEFMDAQTGMNGITPVGLLEAHNADLAIQGEGADQRQTCLGRSGHRNGVLPF